MSDPVNEPPRRRVVMVAKLQADDWRTLQANLMHLATEIARHGSLPASSCSGGYSSGHIFVTSEDGSIDHNSWAKELDAWIEANCPPRPPSEVDSTQVNERREDGRPGTVAGLAQSSDADET